MAVKYPLKKKLLIIDSGMKNLGGHNFSYTRAVQDALADFGVETEVWANKSLQKDTAQEFGFRRVFSQGAYDFPPNKGIKDNLIYIYAQSVLYGNELARAFENKLSDYAGVFCHTIGEFELIGWNRFLLHNELNSHLLLLLRSTPGFRKLRFFKKKLNPFFRIKPKYLKSIHRKLGSKFTLVTDSELLTSDYMTIYGHKIVTLPIPINKYFRSDKKEYAESLSRFRKKYGLDKGNGLCIGYMGDARRAKGFHLLPGLVGALLNKRDDVHFAIQCPRSASGSDDSELPEGVAELQEIRRLAEDRLVLVSERLSEEDYASMFRCLDVLLIPYLLPGYTEATSGIFAEAVALGKPTVVTEKTWMAHELKKFGGGLHVLSDDVKDLTEKVLELIETYEVYEEKSQKFSGVNGVNFIIQMC